MLTPKTPNIALQLVTAACISSIVAGQLDGAKVQKLLAKKTAEFESTLAKSIKEDMPKWTGGLSRKAVEFQFGAARTSVKVRTVNNRDPRSLDVIITTYVSSEVKMQDTSPGELIGYRKRSINEAFTIMIRVNGSGWNKQLAVNPLNVKDSIYDVSCQGLLEQLYENDQIESEAYYRDLIQQYFLYASVDWLKTLRKEPLQ